MTKSHQVNRAYLKQAIDLLCKIKSGQKVCPSAVKNVFEAGSDFYIKENIFFHKNEFMPVIRKIWAII